MAALTVITTRVYERDGTGDGTFIWLDVPASAIGTPDAGDTLHGLVQTVLNGTNVLTTLSISPTDLGGSDFDIDVETEEGATTRYLLPILKTSMGDYITGGTVIEGSLHTIDAAPVLVLPIFSTS